MIQEEGMSMGLWWVVVVVVVGGDVDAHLLINPKVYKRHMMAGKGGE